MGLQLSALKPSFEANSCSASLFFQIGWFLSRSGCGTRPSPKLSVVIQRLPLRSKIRSFTVLILITSGSSLGHLGGVPTGVSISHLMMAADFALMDVLMART